MIGKVLGELDEAKFRQGCYYNGIRLEKKRTKKTLIPKKTLRVSGVPFFWAPSIYYFSLAPQAVICPYSCSFCGFLFVYSVVLHGFFFYVLLSEGGFESPRNLSSPTSTI